MIELRNIKQTGRSRYSMDCHVYDQSLKNPDFFVEFDVDAWKIISPATGDHMIDDVYAKCAMRHIYYMLERHEKIPEASTAAWY